VKWRTGCEGRVSSLKRQYVWDRSRIDSEKNFADVLDKVDEISHHAVDDTHVFTLS
jgi:hypothetical protein